MDTSDRGTELEAVKRERDLYLRLLGLNTLGSIEPFLEDALGLLCEALGVERGYIELYSAESRDCDPPWSLAMGIPDEEILGVRAQLSSNLIAGAMARGEVIESACAVQDSRFEELESVRRNEIRTVLCVPIGLQQPVGVLATGA